LRELARSIIGAEDFLEIYVSASFEECARRDPKGIYARVDAGQVRQFTGRDSTFEPPAPGEATLVLDTEAGTPEQSLEKLHALVASRIHFS
jgi:adenylylsulfate kinase